MVTAIIILTFAFVALALNLIIVARNIEEIKYMIIDLSLEVDDLKRLIKNDKKQQV